MVLGIASACGGQLRARPSAPGVDILGAIRIEGNRAIETSAIEPGLALHGVVRDRAALDPYLLATDTERIRAAYLKRGFFEAKVVNRVEHREGGELSYLQLTPELRGYVSLGGIVIAARARAGAIFGEVLRDKAR